MNARHLFRYARYALAALACLGFGSELQLSSDLAATRPPQHRVDSTDPGTKATQLAHFTLPGGKTMNARHLFRYARYALAALACVGFAWHQLSSDLAETRPPHH